MLLHIARINSVRLRLIREVGCGLCASEPSEVDMKERQFSVLIRRYA